MLPLFDEKMFPNRFVETQLPTKAQIFSRTGQRAVSPAGSYSGDDNVSRVKTPTESAEEFARSAESFSKPEPPKEDLPEQSMRSNSKDRRETLTPISKLEFFTPLEFETCSPSCKIEDCDPLALQKLDYLRKLCGFPLMLNCAYRSVEHDKSKGRNGESYHCAGRAFDIHCVDSKKRFEIISHAPFAGFNGIGVYKTFIHVDDRAVGTLWYGDY